MTVLGSLDVLRFSQGLITVLGAIVVYAALRGYHKRKSSSMLFMGVGFVFITVGAIIDGLLFELLGIDLLAAEALQAGCQAIGFLMIVYSLVGAKS